MYVPEHFSAPSEAALTDLIRTHAFGLIVTPDLQATHIPFLLDETGEGLVLRGHVARANTHWQAFDGANTALAVFQGPQGYISPSWGDCAKLVPTWNYIAVHASGRPRIVEEGPKAASLLIEMTQSQEKGRPAPWSTDDLAVGMVDRLMTALVVFEMPVDRLEGKWKLSQNRSAEDRAAFTSAVAGEGNAALSVAMKLS
ncbi:MAG: transcriptional regulator [Rhodobiaceae bacterium]|nr:MAG: transcriptional regulator [Rhodobiaceae bacterium]